MALKNRSSEKKVGVVFLLMWIAIALFYLTWDGWLYEWQSCGYQGTNQHFDLDLFDLKIQRNADGTIQYLSTNNLHNLIYICYFVVFLGALGLITDRKWMKQGAIAIYPISVVALISTLFPLSNHAYVVQIAYDAVHVISIVLGLYCLSKEEIRVREMFFGIFGTWFFYLLARILLEPWPFWQTNRDAYFSLNQINDMPFYFYGLEYLPVVAILFGINWLFSKTQRKEPVLFWKMIFPLVCSIIIGFILIAAGMIQLQQLDMTANCPLPH